MGAVLAKPVSSQILQRKGNNVYTVGASEMQGFRVNMEDEMTICLSMPSHPELALYGVFDGHAGERASAFLKRELLKRIDALTDPTNPEILSKAVQKLDADFLELDDDREDGSTCVFAIVEKKGAEFEITSVNVGDSRVMVMKADGSAETLTEDHKPENEHENARILAAGGRVQMNRVDGQLAMSRAIGDWQYKASPGRPLNLQKVIAVPDITKTKITNKDVLIVCCDGIVEQLTNEEVCTFVHGIETTRLASKSAPDPAEVARQLLAYSLVKGSKDNHSAIVIYFADGNSYSQKDPQFLPGPFTPYRGDKQFEKAYLEDAAKHGYEGANFEQIVAKAEEGMDLEPVADVGGGGGAGGGFGLNLQQAMRMLTQPREGENGNESLTRLKALLGLGAGGEEEEEPSA